MARAKSIVNQPSASSQAYSTSNYGGDATPGRTFGMPSNLTASAPNNSDTARAMRCVESVTSKLHNLRRRAESVSEALFGSRVTGLGAGGQDGIEPAGLLNALNVELTTQTDLLETLDDILLHMEGRMGLEHDRMPFLATVPVGDRPKSSR